MVHGLADGGEGALHRLADAAFQFHAHIRKSPRQEGGLVFHVAGLPHALIQGPAHHHIGKGLVEVVQGPGGCALGGAEKDVEQEGARQPRDGGAVGEGHPGNHAVDGVDGVVRVAQVQVAQAPHQADEGAQDAQAGEQPRNYLCQLEMGEIPQGGLVVDVVLHIAGQTPLVQLFRVHQKAGPLLLHGLAQEEHVLPVRPARLTGLEHRQVGNPLAEGTGRPLQRGDALAVAHHEGDDHRAIDHQVDELV